MRQYLLLGQAIYLKMQAFLGMLTSSPASLLSVVFRRHFSALFIYIYFKPGLLISGLVEF